jgi:hypothetical protein
VKKRKEALTTTIESLFEQPANRVFKQPARTSESRIAST